MVHYFLFITLKNIFSLAFWLPTISAPEILAIVISARMFHHGTISASAPFGTLDVPADGSFNTGTFLHGEFSTWGIFSKGTFRHGAFRHMDISVQ